MESKLIAIGLLLMTLCISSQASTITVYCPYPDQTKATNVSHIDPNSYYPYAYDAYVPIDIPALGN